MFQLITTFITVFVNFPETWPRHPHA